MPDYLTPEQLIDRLQSAVSASTLKRWRLIDPPRGPGFIRVTDGPRGHVLYPLDEVRAFEERRFGYPRPTRRRG